MEYAVHHNVLNVLIYQICLIGNNHRAAKYVLEGVVQLIWGTSDLMGTVNLDVLGFFMQDNLHKESTTCSSNTWSTNLIIPACLSPKL